MFALNPLRLAMACALGWLTAPALAGAGAPVIAGGLLEQAKGLPVEFSEYFFDTPLAVRVELNGSYLGDAMLMLGRDNTVQLLKYNDFGESSLGDDDRTRWLAALAQPFPLGSCEQACPHDLIALHYSLERSHLSILTREAESDPTEQRFYRPPETSRGVLLNNQLNIAGSESQMYGTYQGTVTASLGQWTGVGQGQLNRSAGHGYSSDDYRLGSLYADHVAGERFVRLGYFNPSTQGLSREPRTLSGLPQSTLGAMFGSSDTLLIHSDQPSATPIYVTPNRPATVEVYRADALIHSAPVEAGLQALDTRKLPGGIYSVEVRLVEDGQVIETREELIYKPTNWRDSSRRWRYNAYLGKGHELLSSQRYSNRDEGFNAGLIGNYLLHPRAILGASLEQLDGTKQYGLSLDWTATEQLSGYANLSRTEGRGNGLDLQAVYRYTSGSIIASHNRTWLYTHSLGRDLPAFVAPRYIREVKDTQQNALSWQHQVTHRGSFNARLTHSDGAVNGVGADLSWLQRSELFGSDATWRASLFDRPGTLGSANRRNRGIDLSLSMQLGAKGNSLYGSLGSRTARDGSREQTVSVNYEHRVDGPVLKSVTGTLDHDSYGVGLGGRASFESAVASGDAYVQSSSYNGELGGGLNLSNTVAMAERGMAIAGSRGEYPSGMVIDVISDAPGVELKSLDGEGLQGTLRAGRNLVPVSAYKPGKLTFDTEGDDGEPISVQPRVARYHLNKGGVAYQQVRIMRTVTVVGRLLDSRQKALPGVIVANHASRSVTEADGFFAVEMSQSTPALEVRQGTRSCLVEVDMALAQRDNDVLLVGDLTCDPREVADAAIAPNHGA
ncbi:TcfC E-set like domain-containing protein [Pseudomonas typographi]|uniref:TcfC E-set like domain-containing protein n=1 Tax=Pseudomonas typographi TaxID=2715964 RepID=UPI001681E221|nr:pilus assembly protein PapC [Pseudomonas typographi]